MTDGYKCCIRCSKIRYLSGPKGKGVRYYQVRWRKQVRDKDLTCWLLLINPTLKVAMPKEGTIDSDCNKSGRSHDWDS